MTETYLYYNIMKLYKSVCNNSINISINTQSKSYKYTKIIIIIIN